MHIGLSMVWTALYLADMHVKLDRPDFPPKLIDR